MADQSLFCQRCHQPLQRDQSAANLTPSQFNLIASTLPAPPPASALPPAAKLAALPPASTSAAAAWSSANSLSNVSESFVLLPEEKAGERALKAVPHPASTSTSTDPSSPVRVASPASQPQLAARLDALLSSRTNIDHPLCTECTGLFQAQLQRELEGLTQERDAYIAFERGLRKRGSARAVGDPDDPSADDTALVGTQDEWDALIARKRELEEEERQLRETLEESEAELQRVKDDDALAKAEEAAVEQDEADLLKSQATLSGQLSHLAHQLSSAKTQLALSTQLLQHLESTNVYNDAFQIGHAPSPSADSHGNIGTINGLRLGGRPSVEWDEINAAWGLVALCIDRLAVKVGCVFETYKIVPLGSFSRIEELSSKGAYELYASGDISPARLLQNRRFSYALVALLDCLRQLLAFGRDAGRAWGSGVEINKDKINGHSIRLPGFAGLPAFGSMSFLGGVEEPGANADEAWTKACRAVLTALKRILVVESEAERGL